MKKEKTAISAKVIADSINPDGDRLTTFEVVFPRWILAEVNTHRALSRNSASSRAIPIEKVIRQVWSDPAEPVAWGRNQKGMQAQQELTGFRRYLARRLFLFARIPAIIIAWALTKVPLHKQIANRILEPWVWHRAILSSTTWENFFLLRCDPGAQPEFQNLAWKVREALSGSTPNQVQWGSWHLPYVDVDVMTLDGEEPQKSSSAACARVSYMRQNERKAVLENVMMCDRLIKAGHWSPLEHPAVAERGQHGNFRGWKQYRKFFPNESGELR